MKLAPGFLNYMQNVGYNALTDIQLMLFCVILQIIKLLWNDLFPYNTLWGNVNLTYKK